MKLSIIHQETYSRGELLLRSFFGIFYLVLPHVFLMAIFGVWGAISNFIAFWSILFTGTYPKSMFDFNVNMQKWSLRFVARNSNLVDGYPEFGPSGNDNKTSLEIPYREKFSRGKLLLRAFFGIFMIFPHAFILLFRMIGGGVLSFLAWWAILFTEKYPLGWHTFQVENIRWQTRLSCFMSNLIEEYPPFHGREE